MPTPSDSQDGARRRDDAARPTHADYHRWLEDHHPYMCNTPGEAGLNALLDWLTEIGWSSAADVARLEAERDEARAEVDGLMVVYDAAVTWAIRHNEEFRYTEGTDGDRELFVAVMANAVGSTQTAPSSPLGTPHTADGGEAGVVEGAGGSEAAEAIRAQADDPCRCGHLRGLHTWRGRACQMCYGCPAFEEVLNDA